MEIFESYQDVVMNQMDKIDLFVIILVLIAAYILRVINANACVNTLIAIFIVGFLLPFLSSGREVERNIAANGQVMDSFELLYAYLVFPIYWVVMLVVLLLLGIRSKPPVGPVEL